MKPTEVRCVYLTDQKTYGPMRCRIVDVESGQVLAEVTIPSWDDPEPLHKAFDVLEAREGDDGQH